jgi:DNA-binding CsgD family transcriptional regulator
MFKAWRSGILPTDPRKDTLINKGTSINKDLVTRSREQILSPKEWERSWEYEILPDVDVGEHLVCWFRTDRSQDAVFAMTLHRPYGDRPFTVRQRNVLHLYNVELYRLFLDGVIPLCADNRPAELLTPRQKEVLARLLSGDGDKQVARRLGISVHTASDHVKAIYRRLGVNSRGELMAKYLGPAST